MASRYLILSILVLNVALGCSGNQFTPVASQGTVEAENDGQIQSEYMARDEDVPVVEDQPEDPAHQTDDKAEGEVEDEEPGEEVDLPPTEKDISGKGNLKPTVYYFPVINEDKKKCTPEWRIRDDKGKIMMTVCESTRAACRLQGSCAIVQKGKMKTFNIVGERDGVDRFFDISKESCRFGFGVKASCLDPFFTIAADLSIYKPGDVIYVPAVVGLELPDGSQHTGYFVVRDTGRAIKGRGRFDFFSGHISWRDDANPFKKIGLTNKAQRFEYYRIKGERAEQIRDERNFPKLPEEIIEH